MQNKNRKYYLDYLKSDEWKAKREHIAKLRNHTCEKCKRIIKFGFHVHHKTYRHLGNELDSELMFLCENCHKKIHNKRKSVKTKTRKTLTCKNCLNKISYSKYIKDVLTRCPYCNSFIGRPKIVKIKRR